MARTIGQDRFLETLEKVCQKASHLGESIIKRDKEAYRNDKNTHTNNIKKEATAYKQSIKAIKEVSGIRKLLPGGKSALLDIAEGQARTTVDKVSGYKLMLEEVTSKAKEVEENEKDLEDARKHADKEFNLVKNLLKTRFIESIRYDSGVGMFWTYPPMVYNDSGKIIFLGRPEAGLSETNTNGFSLKLPSYTPDNQIGTAHMRHDATGNDYCLGGYDDIVKILAAKRQVSSLIRLFKDYFGSFNGKSRHNTPNYLAMDINIPKVNDDSWTEWKKANPKFKMPEPIEAPEEEECSECGDQEGGCDNCN